jgi:hypothetical protein
VSTDAHSAEQQITDDVLDAFVAEASAHESEILAWADGLIVAGSHKAADALSEGFKAKVPLAGGAIGSAIQTAISQMDVEAEGGLKTAFDSVIAQAKAKSLGK